MLHGDFSKHWLVKYELEKATRPPIHIDSSFNGHTTYQIPSHYNIPTNSTRSRCRSFQYALHLLFIVLILIDFTFTNLESSHSTLASLPFILVIFLCSFIFCIITSCFLSKSVLKFLQSVMFQLLLFVLLSLIFFISPPLLLYLCTLYLIKSNPIKYMVQYLNLNPIFNMKHIHFDYNFIPYHYSGANPRDEAIYHYLFSYILIVHESSDCTKSLNSKAATECMAALHNLLCDRSDGEFDVDTDQLLEILDVLNTETLNDIPFSRSSASSSSFSESIFHRFVIGKYITFHMIRDMLSILILFPFITITFWSCYVLHKTNDVLLIFYTISYSTYFVLSIMLSISYLVDIEWTLAHHLGWLKPLYFADGVNIDDLNYIKFMYCYTAILAMTRNLEIVHSLEESTGYLLNDTSRSQVQCRNMCGTQSRDSVIRLIPCHIILHRRKSRKIAKTVRIRDLIDGLHKWSFLRIFH